MCQNLENVSITKGDEIKETSGPREKPQRTPVLRVWRGEMEKNNVEEEPQENSVINCVSESL